VTEEDEIARAQRKARAWKARQAEMAEAACEDARRTARRRKALEAERHETYQERGLRNLVLIGVGARHPADVRTLTGHGGHSGLPGRRQASAPV
jgi:hypothetical protein